MKILTKEQTSNILGILATASLTGVGFALGGTMGAELMKGIGINLTTNYVHGSAVKLKQLWISSNNGVLNHDIQKALTRATIKALENLKNRYMELGGDSISKDDKESVKKFFGYLNEQAKNVFPASLEKAVAEQDVKDYLYGDQDIAVNRIWERISHTTFLDTHREWFKKYFITYFINEMRLLFSEELKTDNRAWRAFQRLLLEGIWADINTLKVNQDLIREDLKKLDEIRKLLKQPEDPRQQNEPFQKGLEIAIYKLGETVQKIGKEIQEMHEDIHILQDINLETYRIVKLWESGESSNFKENQKLLEAIVENYTSQIPKYKSRLMEFVIKNRAEELTNAHTYLQDHRILLISGIAGVGKTTLAQALIDTKPVNIPPPFWFDFSKNMNANLGVILENLAGYLNAPVIVGFKADKREAEQVDINRLTGELQRLEQTWLIFDNLEIIMDGTQFHDPCIDLLFTSLCDSTHNAKIIVTSRVLPLLRNGSCMIDVIEDEKQELRGLKLDFAVDFLKKNGFEKVEYEKLKKLAVGVDGHPLALKLLIELAKESNVSDTLNDPILYQKTKEDTIKKAKRLFEKLAGDEKELLERISVFRKPETMAAISSMFIDKTSRDAVRNLINKSLMITDHKGKYWLHPLIREFSYGDLKNKKEIHWLACLYYQSLKLPEKPTKNDDVQTLIEAHYHAYMAEKYDEAARIIFDNKMDEHLDRWGDYRTLVELYVRVLPKNYFIDKPLISDTKIQLYILEKLGIAYLNLSDFKKSIEYLDKALNIVDDKKSEGILLGYLGKAYFYLRDYKKSIEYYHKALNIAQEIGDRPSEGSWLGGLGLIYCHQGELEKAIEYQEDALKIAQEFKDKKGESTLLGYIGLAITHLYDMKNQIELKKAIKYQEDALKIASEIGDRRNEGIHIGNFGIPYLYQKDANRAMYYFDKALKIAQEIGDRRNESMWLGLLSRSHYFLGNLEKSTEYLEEALKIAQEIGVGETENMLLSLSENYKNLKQPEKAQECLNKAFQIKDVL